MLAEPAVPQSNLIDPVGAECGCPASSVTSLVAAQQMPNDRRGSPISARVTVSRRAGEWSMISRSAKSSRTRAAASERRVGWVSSGGQGQGRFSQGCGSEPAVASALVRGPGKGARAFL